MRKLSLPDKAYGNLLKFILDENITDINWSQGLWVNDLNKGRYKIKGFTLDDNFIQQFYTRISNLMNVQFNKNNPLLEAETDNLRISILHDSVTNTVFKVKKLTDTDVLVEVKSYNYQKTKVINISKRTVNVITQAINFQAGTKLKVYAR